MNGVNRIIRLASVTPNKKEKGFKLYVLSYIDNFEGTILRLTLASFMTVHTLIVCVLFT